ncbi:MAG: hypothetical protein D4R95_03440 [Actinobacteria bacterium]|nr:MAG: hypothetical protein D4R95_03440 [Actinomycetota bacterium]
MHVPEFDELAVSVVPLIEQYNVPVTTVYVVAPAVPKESVVLNVVVAESARDVDDALTVTVREVLPVVNESVSP